MPETNVFTGRCANRNVRLSEAPAPGATRQHQVRAEAKRAGCAHAPCARQVSAESGQSPRESCFLLRLRRVLVRPSHLGPRLTLAPQKPCPPHVQILQEAPDDSRDLTPPAAPAPVLPSEPGVLPLTSPPQPLHPLHTPPPTSRALCLGINAQNVWPFFHPLLPSLGKLLSSAPQNTLSTPCHMLNKKQLTASPHLGLLLWGLLRKGPRGHT